MTQTNQPHHDPIETAFRAAHRFGMGLLLHQRLQLLLAALQRFESKEPELDLEMPLEIALKLSGPEPVVIDAKGIHLLRRKAMVTDPKHYEMVSHMHELVSLFRPPENREDCLRELAMMALMLEGEGISA